MRIFVPAVVGRDFIVAVCSGKSARTNGLYNKIRSFFLKNLLIIFFTLYSIASFRSNQHLEYLDFFHKIDPNDKLHYQHNVE